MRYGAAPGIDHSGFAAQRVKDAVVDVLREATGQRPSVDVAAPDLRLNLLLRKGRAILAVDLGGGALHRRGWRGQAVDARSVDLRTTGIVLEKNGQVVALGAGAAVVGHPAAAVAMLVNHLGRRGKSLPAGSLVLSGGITEAVSVQAGDHVNLRVQGMGSVSLRFA